jgi:nicotinate-nucleotide adenylyltransferase
VRLGIFGGSFDPPHVGHLLAAVDAVEQLPLDRLVFVPSAVQPLKVGRAAASAADRLEMVRRLVGHDSRLAVDAIEIDRAGLSFTVDTLETFARSYPEAERFFLVGADALQSFGAWRNPEGILELARLVVLRLPGSPADSESVPAGAMTLVTRLVDVSSTEVRERARAGKPIRGFVPESVAEYIETKRLYR